MTAKMLRDNSGDGSKSVEFKLENYLSKSRYVRIIQAGAIFVLITPMACITFSMEAFRSQTGGKYSDLSDEQLARGIVWAVVTFFVNCPSTTFFFLKLTQKYYRLRRGEMPLSEILSNIIGGLFSAFVVSAGISFSLEGLKKDLGIGAIPFAAAYAGYVFATRLFGTGDVLQTTYKGLLTLIRLCRFKKARQLFSVIWDIFSHAGQFECDVNGGLQQDIINFFRKITDNGTARYGIEWINNRVILPSLTVAALAYATGMLPVLMTMVENGLPASFKPAATEISWVGGVVQQFFFWKVASLFLDTIGSFNSRLIGKGWWLTASVIVTSGVMGAGLISGGALEGYVNNNKIGQVAKTTLLVDGGVYTSYWETMIHPLLSSIAAFLAGCVANGATTLAMAILFFLPPLYTDRVLEGLYDLIDEVKDNSGDKVGSIPLLSPTNELNIDKLVDVQQEWRTKAPVFGLFGGSRGRSLEDSGIGAGLNTTSSVN